MENQNLSNLNSLNKNTSRRAARRRSKQEKYHRQEYRLKQIFTELEELRAYHRSEISQLGDLEQSLETLQVQRLKQEKELLELKFQLQQLRAFPNQINQALNWVVHAFCLAREQLQQQEQIVELNE